MEDLVGIAGIAVVEGVHSPVELVVHIPVVGVRIAGILDVVVAVAVEEDILAADIAAAAVVDIHSLVVELAHKLEEVVVLHILSV